MKVIPRDFSSLANLNINTLIIKTTPASCYVKNPIYYTARVSHGLIHITDWLPTFFSLAGGNPNHVVEGEGFDVWDIIDNEAPPKR